MRTSRVALALILLLAAAPGFAQEKPKPVPLPEDVAAIIRGSILSRDRFRSALVDRYGYTEDGQRALSNLVEEIPQVLDLAFGDMRFDIKDWLTVGTEWMMDSGNQSLESRNFGWLMNNSGALSGYFLQLNRTHFKEPASDEDERSSIKAPVRLC